MTHESQVPPNLPSLFTMPLDLRVGLELHELRDFEVTDFGHWKCFAKHVLRGAGYKITIGYTLLETNSSPLKIGHPKRKLVFQPSTFRCKPLVSGRVYIYIYDYSLCTLQYHIRICSWICMCSVYLPLHLLI